MNREIIISQVITLFLLIGVGFAARKTRILTSKRNKGLTDILLNITAPCMAVASFQFAFSKALLHNAWIVLIFAVAAHLIAILLGKLLFFKIPEATRKVLWFGMIFSNCGFMGFPIMESLFGKEGVFYTSIYVAVFNLFVWTYGVMIFTGKIDRRSLKNMLLNPSIIAVFCGAFIFLFSIKLPVPISQALQLLGAMTTPISMIVVGSMLADVEPASIFSGFSIYYGTILRLLVIPFLALGVLRWLNIDGIVLGVCVLFLAMPIAALSVPLAEKYGGDASMASRIVFLSTIFSVFTIPAIIWWI